MQTARSAGAFGFPTDHSALLGGGGGMTGRGDRGEGEVGRARSGKGQVRIQSER